MWSSSTDHFFQSLEKKTIRAKGLHKGRPGKNRKEKGQKKEVRSNF